MWFATTIRALDPITGEMKHWIGPNIEAPSMALAQEYCQNNGLGYCKIEGQLIAEIPVDPATGSVQWHKQTNFEGLN